MKFPPKVTPQQPAPSMTMIMVPEEEWRTLHDTLEQIIDLITRRNADDSGSEWIESEDARKILGVSPKTWQNYRDKRIIPFSQIGRKIYVNRADLDAFLRKHRISGRKND
jgi:hypothetical protein